MIKQISDVHQRLLKATLFVQKNLKLRVSVKMKSWCDKKAHTRQFKPGDKVLVLLPIHGHSLQAHYNWPFVVEKRMNDVDYVIKTLGRCKDRRLCMLKVYQVREAADKFNHKTVSGYYLNRLQIFYPVESAVEGPKLNTSDILYHLDQKLKTFT